MANHLTHSDLLNTELIAIKNADNSYSVKDFNSDKIYDVDFIPKHSLAYSYNKGFIMTPSIKPSGVDYIKWDKTNSRVQAPNNNRFSKPAKKVKAQPVEESTMTESNIKDDETIKLIHDSYKLKPSYLTISEAKWKVLVRGALRGLNIIMTGDAGEGKTLAAYALKDALQRPFFYVNMGNTQDAQTSLIGKTHLDADTGTYFSESYFVKAIQTPNAVILLDELTRASFDAMNILITVLDKKQRYLRVNDDPDSPTIKVASGVSFIATANIGFKYSGTVKLDHAILDRFIKVEVDPLTSSDRLSLIINLHGKENKKLHESLVSISADLTFNIKSTDPQVSVAPSTRQVLEMAEFIEDGFTLAETLDVLLFPMYDEEERSFVRTIVQKYDEKIKDEDNLNQSNLKTAPPSWE